MFLAAQSMCKLTIIHWEQCWKTALHGSNAVTEDAVNTAEVRSEVKYIRNTDLHVADALSKNYLQEMEPMTNKDVTVCMVNYILMSETKWVAADSEP